MNTKLVLGPFDKGLRKDVLPFVIDNNSFPTLVNAYQWRGRVKRKRGTQTLGRGTRYFNSTSVSYSLTSTITLDVDGIGNILTGFSLQTNGGVIPGTVTLVGFLGSVTYTDPTMDGYLTPTGTLGVNTIIYASGQITIPAQANQTVTAIFRYYPDLPSMGFRELNNTTLIEPGNIAFDTTYAYNVKNLFPYVIYDVSFYKNPPSDPDIAYVEKTNPTPVKWNGQNYQQFWTTNYQNALWATNGITVPFTTINVGMQFARADTITFVSQTATTIELIITNSPLVVGDFVFFNEWTSSSDANSQTLNFQTGFVTSATPNTAPYAAKTVIITLPDAALAADTYIPGIVQYLTNSSDITKDCIRWYDGDPTNEDPVTPILNGNKGWVNFCPPLSVDNYSIADLPRRKYYLVGGRMIFSYKDRLVVLGPVVQTSTDQPIYLQDTAIYSQNGTPYYTASFTGDPTLPTTIWNGLLLPDDQTAAANSWYEDVFGYGGFISAGRNIPITTMEFNEDVPIIGFKGGIQTRFIYTSDDIQPFLFYLINSEYGSSSTFSAINTDDGIITRGDRGLILTSQNTCGRIDLLIPDQVFGEMKTINNGNERMTAGRDFINEWIYFTYPASNIDYVFPTQTLFYNYRDQSWAVFNESYTCYGQFEKRTGFTWDTVGSIYPTWDDWNDTWDYGVSSLSKPLIVGGNQQGFLIIKGVGTGEEPSLYIKDISSITVTSPDHCLSTGDFIQIKNTIGTSSGIVNNQIFQVRVIDKDSFFILSDPSLEWTGTYFGGGTITRLYRPFIQTKQFPVAWEFARKTRIGVQQYLFTRTSDAEVQILIFLSQNQDNPYNIGPIYPAPNTVNSSLVYTTKLFTCPESSNLGLSQFKKNLQMPNALQQEQIWHRMNTSLIGDTVQIGITLSDDQMKNIDVVMDEIELHSIIMDLSPAGLLA